MTSLLLEIRQAWRGLLRAPGYSASVMLTLALGVAAVASVFALVDGVLLRPLPYPEAERLVLARQQNLQTDWNTSVVDFLAIRDQSRSFEAVAAMRSLDVILTDGAESQWVEARLVTAGFFDVMGIAPARGRGFQPGEDSPAASPVVVLSDAFANRHFGAATDPIGRTITLEGVAHTVVGIMPPGVGRLPGMRADVWPAMQLDEPGRRGPFLLSTVGRLKPGVTLEEATTDLAAISRRIFPLWQAGFQDETALLTPRSLHKAIVGDSGTFLWIALGAVLVVLLIAIVNVTNLVLMRATERLRDLAVRAALGAGRKRLARFLVTENLLLAAMGGIAGVGLAAILLELYRALGPDLPLLTEVAIDWRVTGFVVLLVLATGLLLGLVPLLFAGAGKGALLQQERGGSAREGQHLLRNGLVVLEFALALPLLIAAGLLINSLMQLERVDPGFEADHLLTARVRLLETTYPDELTRLAFWQRALTELETLPGVIAAGLATGIPPDSPATFNNFDLVGRPAAQGSQPMSPWTPVLPGFFEALGVRVIEGRNFNAGDTPDSPLVVLVSETWAKRYFPGGTAVGKELYEGGDRTRTVTIVGVTSDVRFAGLERPADSVYAPISQGWWNNPAYLYLRTGPDPIALVGPMRAALARLDPALVPTEVTTMESRLRDSLGDERSRATVVVAFALLAVLLSAVGVSAVLAYYVSRQRREIGIRLALGADAGRVLGLVIRRGLGCALAGTLIGLVPAFFLTRGLESLLFRVEPTDLPTLVLACLTLLVIALIASWLPARRAARVDPMVALRLE